MLGRASAVAVGHLLAGCWVAAALSVSCNSGRDSSPTPVPSEALAKLAPPLHPLLDSTVEARVRREVATIRRLAPQPATTEGWDELRAAEDALLTISPSLHPREQIVDDEPLLTLFLSVVDLASARAAVEAAGGVVLTDATTTLLVRVPYPALRHLATSGAIRSIQPDTIGTLDLDVSVAEVNADDVHATGTPSYTGPLMGEGVVIGIVDTGVDFKHEDLRRPDGSTRVLAYWDPCACVGACPFAPVDVSPDGVEYTQEQIDTELAAPETAVPALDTIGHGTHIAGIAASDGSATGTHTGLAPTAGIIAVGDVTAGCSVFLPPPPLIVAPFGTSLASFDSHIVQGVDFVFERARSRGRPAVVNLAAGATNTGPHDGTTSYETMLDELSGPGRIVVSPRATMRARPGARNTSTRAVWSRLVIV